MPACLNESMSRAIMNTTRQTCLAREVIVAETVWQRFKGLMLQPDLPKDHGLWIAPCSSIHSFFMRFSFDAVFVDRNLIVLHTIQSMKPWRISRFVARGHAVLELQAGTITRARTEVGDQLAWQAAETPE